MSIDWGKAPEGATHWDSGMNNRVEGWMKLDDGAWYWWPSSEAPIDKKWYASLNQHRINPEGFIERPSPWSGEGQPPIGTEIEALLPGLGSTTYFWQRAKVVHDALPDSPGEVLVFSLETTRPAWVDEFRPVRTPEQIAAEKRSIAVDDMREIVTHESLKGLGLTLHLEALYDAGYHKQVTP